MRTILLASLLFAAGAGCGQETDDRRATVEYLVPAIFRPSCGNAACHSSATARRGLIFDTVQGTCDAFPVQEYLVGEGAIGTSGRKVRMPLDAPLPQADIDLITGWENDGKAGCF